LVLGAILAMLLGVSNAKINDEVNQVQTVVTRSNETALSIDINPKSGGTLNWMDALKALAENVLVPVLFPEEEMVAAAVTVMIELFWPPAEEEDVWDQIEDQVQELVNTAILKEILEGLEADIATLKIKTNDYARAKGEERANIMDDILFKCTDTNQHIKSYKDTHMHTIGITITLAYIHLNMLRERLLYGKFYFDVDNSEVWSEDLENAVVDYQHYLSSAYEEWRIWRKDRIEKRTWTDTVFWPYKDAYGEAHDLETDRRIKFKQGGSSIDDYFEYEVGRAQMFMFNELRGQFMRQLYQASFNLIRFIPGMEDHLEYALPQDRILDFGPYQPYMLQYMKNHELHEGKPALGVYWDKPNSKVLSKIAISEGNYIDGLQFTYEDLNGHVAGRLDGSPIEFAIDGNNVTLLNVTMGYYNAHETGGYGLTEMQLWFSDGTKSEILGNHGGKTDLNRVMAGNISPRFKCINNGGGGTVYYTVGTMWLQFMHDVPDDEFTESLANRWSLMNSQLMEE